MRNPFRTLRPRSNGVPVTRAALLHIRLGDAARARGRWAEAAAAYRDALAAMPDLQHIWMQYAHAAKEAGDDRAARDGYGRAAALAPGEAEPHMFLGHMAKRAGSDAAARHYLDALARAPDDLGAIGEVMQQLLGSRLGDDALIDEALTLLGIDRAAVTPAPEQAAAPGTLFLDVTDLLSFFSFSRIPSGVQRVQIEVVLALLDAGRGPFALCYYSPARRGWTRVAGGTFRALCAASLRDDGRRGTSWAHELRLVYVASALSGEAIFPDGAVLVSLGANSPHPNYLLDIRTACARTGAVYVPLMYDLIPVLFPHWVVPAHARDFSAWLASLIHTARGFLAISETTRTDILAYARDAGQPFDQRLARVVRLDGDSVKRNRERLPAARLAQFGLAPGGYVLFVSTIEPRKNHLGAFAAWKRLAAELGRRDMPQLVCVGGKGWLNGEVHAMLAADPALRETVKILSGVADDELDLLYRECAFTIYPSLYEGWGLPVTESLSYGKVPAIANRASLPEAGGALAVYYDPRDIDAMVAAIRPLIADPEARAAREAEIARRFAPRSWLAIGDQLLADAHAIADALRDAGERVPVAVGGRPIGLAAASALRPETADGEVFRHGKGWELPEADGCRATGTDSILRLVAAADATLTLTLGLARADAATGYAIAGGESAPAGGLAPGERCAVAVRIAAGPVELSIRATGPLLVEGFALSA